MFWRKKKPVPVHKRMWAEARAAIAILTTTIGVMSSAIAWIQIDTSSFEQTTKVISVSANGRLYTKIKTSVELAELSYIIVNINGSQVEHLVYPEGLKRGEIVLDTKLPFNVIKDKTLDVSIDIIFVGPKTLFQPQRLTTQTLVTQEDSNVKSNSSFISNGSTSKYLSV